MIRKSRNYRKLILPGLLVILVLAVAGIYLWQHHKVSQLNTQVSKLNGQVQSLQSQVKSDQEQAKTQSQASRKQAADSGVPSSCSGSGMKLTLGPPNGTAGTTYIDALITNKSGHACTLEGYPVATLTDSNSQTLGQQATQSGSGPAMTVTLQPGKAAHASLGFPDPGALSPGSCLQAAFINIQLPGDSTTLQTSTTQQYCPGFSVSALAAGN